MDLCIHKDPDKNELEYDCPSCDGTFENSKCGGEYFYIERIEMELYLKRALEEVDAYVLSSDSFLDDKNREIFRSYIQSWERTLKEFDKLSEELND